MYGLNSIFSGCFGKNDLEVRDESDEEDTQPPDVVMREPDIPLEQEF